MNDNFTSLVFFTVLCQTAVGALIFRGLVLLRSGDGIFDFEAGRLSLIAIAVLLILSLGIAFLHLGKPVHAINALNNIRGSWLSREILSLTVLTATLLLCLFLLGKSNSVKIDMIFLFVSYTAGISLIYAMIRLYMIPGIASWNSPFTPVSFIITTFLCGLAFIAVINGKSFNGFNSVALPLISVFIISSIINSILFPGSFINQNLTLFIVRTVLAFLSLCVVAAFYFSTQSNKFFIWWVIMFIMILSSEIINRYIFFLSFEKSGL
jgi:anaerobic dimethyl sulfoxide reductase subunit C